MFAKRFELSSYLKNFGYCWAKRACVNDTLRMRDHHVGRLE